MNDVTAGHQRIDVTLRVNSSDYPLSVPPTQRLAETLRDDLSLKGVKIGCDAGDCGACTILIAGRQACACMIPTAQAEGQSIVTVEGLASHGTLTRIQEAFHRHGAAQCGICTPGMIMAAVELLGYSERPEREIIEEVLGGVLCRCTGYQKIVEAIEDAIDPHDQALPTSEPDAVGARAERVDGFGKITGQAAFGADAVPADALWLKVVRSPYASATFEIGDLDLLIGTHAGLVDCLTAKDIKGINGFGVYPDVKDQPVLAGDLVRYRGDAVLALIGTRKALEALSPEDIPITYRPAAPVHTIAEAMAPEAPQLHDKYPGNQLIQAQLRYGDADTAMATAAHRVSGDFHTAFVEHAYIEPEAGYAQIVDGRFEIYVTTQSPYLDRDETANILGVPADRVRIIPSAVGGGFGGKLDLSVQPLLALAAYKTGRPVAIAYTRPESMMTSTKRHPAEITAELAADRSGNLLAMRFTGNFNTGAYASWGPTVAGRVPVHACGPYRLPNLSVDAAAYYTNNPPAGAFRGFGVPQAAIAHETLMNALAAKVEMDPLRFRLHNALRAGDETVTGQVLQQSVGIAACLEALLVPWDAARERAERFNQSPQPSHLRRGVGIGAMFYGIGNSGMSNPSAMRLAWAPDGTLTLLNGAVDIGQGSSTIMAQIAAEALGLPAAHVHQVIGDTDLTEDAGKTSASRQTYVSGNAAAAAGADLRAQILRLANAGDNAQLQLEGSTVHVSDAGRKSQVELERLPALPAEKGISEAVLIGRGRFDPPTTALNPQGQGAPYATYAFGAQMAEVQVDIELGTVKVTHVTAAHDLGRAINPTLAEGQIQGGIAQGLGLALMEEYLPGVTENLHDYLIPTFGDMPDMAVILIEDPEPTGPFGAKGVGEPGLIPTAPAILGAIQHATGVAIHQVPVRPDRLLAALQQQSQRKTAG